MSITQQIREFMEVNEKWVADAQRFTFRYIELSEIFFDLLTHVDRPTQEEFLLRFRGIDKRIRSMYHSNKVTQSHNGQSDEQSKTSLESADSKESTGGAMEEE